MRGRQSCAWEKMYCSFWPWFVFPTIAQGQVGRTAGEPAWSTLCVRTYPALKVCQASGISSARPMTDTPTRRKVSWQLSLLMVSFFFFLSSFSIHLQDSHFLVRRLQYVPLSCGKNSLQLVPLGAPCSSFSLLSRRYMSVLYLTFCNAGEEMP